MVDFAAAAQTQDETRFVAGAVNMLARHHETVAPLAQVMAPGPIIGRTAGGALVVPAPVDYIAWTERVARISQRDDLKTAGPTALVSGRVSPSAMKEVTALGWKVNQSIGISAER